MRVEIAEIKPRQKYSLAKIAKLNTSKVYGNAISAWGIEQRGSHFGSFSFLCSTKVAGGHFITLWENPPALYDIHAFSPGFSGDLFIENLCTAKPPFHSGGHNVFQFLSRVTRKLLDVYFSSVLLTFQHLLYQCVFSRAPFH